eukprot:Skav211009  [mRNA]  locus=scaffold1610:424550:429403:+ [translate_table: standard]
MKFLLVISAFLSVACALRPQHDHDDLADAGNAHYHGDFYGAASDYKAKTGGMSCCGCPKKKTMGIKRDKCKEDPGRRNDCDYGCTSTSDTKCWAQSKEEDCAEP